MNHARNTPGYPVRAQVVFTNRDSVTRAYMLVELHGQGALVEIPLATAEGWAAKDLVDEYRGPVPEQFGGRVPFVKGGKIDCGCGGGEGVEVVAASLSLLAVRAGRLAGEDAVGEPLFAVADGDGYKVACEGAECAGEDLREGTPSQVRFDRYAVADDGGYELKDSVSAPLPENLINLYGKRAPACLPWVRVTRDPKRFRACLERAQKIGPMTSSKSVYRLVGEYMEEQDQEVFLAILVDSQLQVRAVSEVARGSRDRTTVSIPDTLRVALVEGAMAFIVVHNHPSGRVDPSEADVKLTSALRDAAKTVNLELLDHVIVGSGRYYSFAKSRPYKERRKS